MNDSDEKKEAMMAREIAKAAAIRESMVEVMRENQQEIIARTIRKLKAKGIIVSVGELEKTQV